jgi:hypothetical protein
MSYKAMHGALYKNLAMIQQLMFYDGQLAQDNGHHIF